jgi:putative ABC transport system permease protein
MIKNYFKIAWRNLLKNKGFSAINIIGLAVGIASCLLITLYVTNEFSYDNFHEKGNRIVRVVMEYGSDNDVSKVGVTGTKAAPSFKRAFPEVEAGVRMYATDRGVKSGEKLFNEKNFYYADSAFFDVFSFKLLVGNPKKALSEPNTVVISENTAKKYFGTENPIGKIIRVNDTKDFAITGIAANCPQNSQIQFDFLASFTSLRAAQEEETWANANWTTFLLLNEEKNIKPLQAKIQPFLATQMSKEEMAESHLNFILEPFTTVHLYSDVENAFQPNINVTYLYIFLAVALLILAIASFTYMNLTTARATERAREVGMRKVLGAARKQLFWQFIAESAVITTVALLIGVLLSKVFLASFNALIDKKLAFSAIFSPINLVLILGMSFSITLLAGSYPALVLSGFQPIKVLKGAFKTSFSGLFLRKSLIVFQFGISVFLIIATLTIQNQLHFIQQKKLGYNKEHVLVLPLDSKSNEKLSTFKTVLSSNPEVLGVTGAYETPVFINGGYAMWGEGMPQGKRKSIAALPIDENFVKTMGLEIVAGNNLSDADMKRIMDKDYKKNYFYFTLNESAVKSMGWTNENAIGRKMDMGDPRQGEVKAVIKDFHFASLHQKIEPLILFPDTYFNTLMVRLSGKEMPKTLAFVGEKWKELAPNRPFDYEFMDEEFNRLYTSETQIGKAFSVFASLAIFLACLGLFGLATFTILQRTKEIGIRKVLGASIPNIIQLLSKDFLKLIMVSILIASPLAYWVMSRWLQDFVYRINISLSVFVLAGVMALLIALLTVSFQAIKAAVANPVKSLRTE